MAVIARNEVRFEMEVIHENKNNENRLDHTCRICGRIGKWRESWSYNLLIVGKGYRAGEDVFKTCSEECRREAVKQGKLKQDDINAVIGENCKIIMIKEFNGEYRFLSNFAPVEIWLEGILYQSVEHAYMSAKSSDPDWKTYCANQARSATAVKRQSKNIQLREDWEQIKISVMEECLKQKFSQEPFKTLLISTGDAEIQEGNWWGDTFWGFCFKTNTGENNLGKLIMKIRKELQDEKTA